MYRNALTRRITRETRPALVIADDEQTRTIRFQPARTNCRRAAIDASRSGIYR